MTDATNETPQAKKNIGWRKVAAIIVCLFAMVQIFRFSQWIRQADVLYEAGKAGAPLVEALETSPAWSFFSFNQSSGDPCGMITKLGGGDLKYSPMPKGPISSYTNVRNFFQAQPQTFSTCPNFNVFYYVFMFNYKIVELQVDADVRIILAKEPRNSD